MTKNRTVLDFNSKEGRVVAIGKLTHALNFYQQEIIALDKLRKPFDKIVQRYNDAYILVPRRFRNRQDSKGFGVRHRYANRIHPIVDYAEVAERRVEEVTKFLRNLPDSGMYQIHYNYEPNSLELLNWLEELERETVYLERVLVVRRALYALFPWSIGFLAYDAYGIYSAAAVTAVAAYLSPILYDKCR